MRVNDQLPVTIQGLTVAHAVIEQIEDGVAVLVIPATRFKLGIRMELTELVPEVERAFTTQEAPDGN